MKTYISKQKGRGRLGCIMSREILPDSVIIESFDIINSCKQMFLYTDYASYVEFHYNPKLFSYIEKALQCEKIIKEHAEQKDLQMRKHFEFIKQISDYGDIDGSNFYRKE